ncbi:ornithine cyclodeaminase [Streptomyces avermitilis]|uniref:ornithine cyclodeaminase n=1 Tax=Streptomyces avermitilis TaxID=33903 RepID=UPI0033C22959
MKPDRIRILDRATVMRCLAEIDPVSVVESTVCEHTLGRSDLPAEGYMAWENSAGAYTRSVAMLGCVQQGRSMAYGIKLINASVSNPALGIERAGGFTVLFDPETARPVTLVEAGHVSAVRTAAYTMSSLRTLGPTDFEAVSIIGCGTIAAMHAKLLVQYFPAVRELHLYDIAPARTAALGRDLATHCPDLTVTEHPDAESCVKASHVVVTLTVSSEPYIPPGWFAPGTFIAHVSLDDVMPAAFLEAEAIYVDDIDLVRDNPRRVLGSVMQAGDVVADTESSSGHGHAVARRYGEVLLGREEAIRPQDGLVVSNPFGMAILDVAVCQEVAARAEAAGLGTVVDLMGDRERADV